MKKIILFVFIFCLGFLQAQVKNKSNPTKKKVEKEWINPVKLTKEELSRPYMDEVLKTRDSLTPKEAERRRKNIAIGNPFAKYGVYPKIATLSKGKYLEFHDKDSIVIIGSIKYNTKQKKIVELLEIDLSDPDAQPIGDTHGRWISPDPLSEEYSSWSPYNYVMNTPINAIDPDGRYIIFITKDNVQLQYKSGNFYYINGNQRGEKYNGSTQSVSADLFRLAKVYRKIEHSEDEDLKGMLHHLENSTEKHRVYEAENDDVASGVIELHDGSQTTLNFSNKQKAKFKKIEKIDNTDMAITTHEMQHQYDDDINNTQDNTHKPNASNPAEQRAVKTENKGRKLDNIPNRTTYGGKKVNPNPPNYIAPNDKKKEKK